MAGKDIGLLQNIFLNATTHVQETQLFIATHSDHILARALDDTNTLVLRITDNGANLSAARTDVRLLPVPTAAEINYLAFGIYSVDYHIQLYGQLQKNVELNTGNAPNIKQTDESIKQQPHNIRLIQLCM